MPDTDSESEGVVTGCEYQPEGGWRERLARGVCEGKGLPYPDGEGATESVGWSCSYEPTMNENWHDDVICRNGQESHRPSLLEGQFVTEDDMRSAAADYEAYLNSQ